MALKRHSGNWIMSGNLADRPNANTGGQTARVFIQEDSAGSGEGVYLDDGVSGIWVQKASLPGGGSAITALTGDVTATGPGSVAATIAANAVTDVKLRDSAALSVIGRSANSLGDPADIVAGTDGHLLRRAGTAVGFGLVAAGAFPTAPGIVTPAMLDNGAAVSVLARSANSSGVRADIAAASNDQYFGRRANALGFFTLDAAALGIVREKLTAARTYYVRTDGSDSNTGLVNSAGGAFLTIQRAIDVVSGTLDLGGQNATIQVGNGTYTGSNELKPLFGGTCSIIGDTTTPSNVLVSTTTLPCFYTAQRGVINYYIRGFKVTATTSYLIGADLGAFYALGEIDFGAAAAGGAAHIFCIGKSTIGMANNYTISGDAYNHIFTLDQALVQNIGKTITFSGTRAFNTFVVADSLSEIWMSGITFGGSAASATGTRYRAEMNGIIKTAGGGASYFPGNVAGITLSGAQYN